MSVATKNPFALLNDDDGADSAPPPAQVPTPASIPAAKTLQKDQRPKTGPASRGGRYYPRGGATSKSTPKEGQEGDSDAPPRENRRFEGGEGQTRGRGRGSRGGRGRGGQVGGRGRQFDRHSGGLPDSEKKVNQAWGANEGKAELTAEVQGQTDAVKDSAADNWADGIAAPTEGAGDGWGGETAGAAPNATPNGTGETRRPKEEEDNSLTFDEYLAKKVQSEVIPKIDAVRKPNEGADESQWKNTVPLAKAKEEDNYFVGKVKAAPKTRAKKEEKVHIEIDARFERPSSRGGPRGGRGRGGADRDERPRGAGRGGGSRGDRHGVQHVDVNVADQAAFPSLS
ncbi:hypothetical protein BU17DRAFT_67627 [Hysterangium stoloniferum]|nr:hypothetical protein BU17DRAFT_67627 [Hysterangium stoloniferum]